ncbi:hypothetical protein ACQEVZ_44995 [Dactylosporangium sp. CA-152071]|uniref:hypothetical protein n=1 Tax=Dactylosporangium sp. CA-152071 TaxID=3239933 RepID=UPI003D937610
MAAFPVPSTRLESPGELVLRAAVAAYLGRYRGQTRQHSESDLRVFVTTMLDAGVSLRDVQIAARHADPRTTMRYDRARNNLDRHPNYILAAYMASGT